MKKVVLLLLMGCFAFANVPLSVTNNNPGNIKYSKKNQWVGSIYKKGTFEKFETKYHGVRAMVAVVIKNIQKTDSVKGFVKRYAAEYTESMEDLHLVRYRQALEKKLGYSGKIKLEDTYKVIQVVVLKEGGEPAVDYFLGKNVKLKG